MNDLKFSKYSPKISNCLYNNIKHTENVMNWRTYTVNILICIGVYLSPMSMSILLIAVIFQVCQY